MGCSGRLFDGFCTKLCLYIICIYLLISHLVEWLRLVIYNNRLYTWLFEWSFLRSFCMDWHTSKLSLLISLRLWRCH